MQAQVRPDFPEQIETARLLLRAPREGDGAEVNAAVRETYADLHQWMEWAGYVPEVEETEQRGQSARAKFLAGEDFTVRAYLKTTGALALCAGLHPLDWNVPKFEIGYWCRAGYQGQGYVTETVQTLTHIGFDVFGANRIEIRCDARNLRSRRVAERAGYALEATLQNDMVAPDGKLRDTLLYALFPKTYLVLETPRLLLRPMLAADVDALLLIFSDPNVMATPFTREQMERWVQRNLDHQAEHGYGLFSVFHKTEGVLIGDCGLERMEVAGENEHELGYDFRSDHWNQGYATEAAAAVRDYAFHTLRLPRLISLIRVGNSASRRVAEKIGMRLEAEITRYDTPYWKYVRQRPE